MNNVTTIPVSRDQITVDWIRHALAAGSDSEVPNIEDVIIEAREPGQMGEVIRCRLIFSDDSTSFPKSLVVKMISAKPKNNRMSKRLKLYKIEYDFYRLIAPHAPVQTPAVLFGKFDEKTQNFVLILEYFENRRVIDLFESADKEQAQSAVREIAKLHGHFWNRVDNPPFDQIIRTLNPKRVRLVQLAYLACVPPCLKLFGEKLTERSRKVIRSYGLELNDLAAAMVAEPKTIIHGDYRLSNILFSNDNSDNIALIDWQVSGVSNGLYDVAYFLSYSVTTETRRRIERELLAEYYENVCSIGVKDFTFEQCWNLYRKNMLTCLALAVFASGGLDLNDEYSMKSAELILTRTVTAVEDLDCDKFLENRSSILNPLNIIPALSLCVYNCKKILGR